MAKNVEPKTVSCGCCSNGCCCFNHQDAPAGRPPHICELHKERILAAERLAKDAYERGNKRAGNHHWKYVDICTKVYFGTVSERVRSIEPYRGTDLNVVDPHGNTLHGKSWLK